MFEIASRQKLRFESSKGLLTVEDLWDLPLTSINKVNLDDLARDLFQQLKNENVSFVAPAKASDTTLQLKFDLVKHVIDVKIAERDVAAVAARNREKKQLLLSIIAQKENEQLLGSSLDDLRKMADEL